MGSGRGQSRRANAATITDVRTVDPSFSAVGNWRGFVDSNGLTGVSLGKYYLGTEPDPMTISDYEKISQELFREMMIVGAFPSVKESAEDFTMHLQPSPFYSGDAPGSGFYLAADLIIQNVRTQQRGNVFIRTEDFLDPERKMGDSHVKSVLLGISVALKMATEASRP
jgi:hypothetical protein